MVQIMVITEEILNDLSAKAKENPRLRQSMDRFMVYG